MSEQDRLWCTLRETQERVTELEARLSLLEDEEEYEYEDGDEHVTLEDWPQDEEEDFVDAEWIDLAQATLRARDIQGDEVTNEPES